MVKRGTNIIVITNNAASTSVKIMVRSRVRKIQYYQPNMLIA
jgi:hypothetical protein